MIEIQVVGEDGERFRMVVVQFEFVRKCPHCQQEFLTVDPDQIYPDGNHKQRAYEMRVKRRVTMPSLMKAVSTLVSG